MLLCHNLPNSRICCHQSIPSLSWQCMQYMSNFTNSGVGSTVIALCQSYWIPTARQYVKSLLRSCIVCRKHSGKPYVAPDPGPLPKIRMQDVHPFSVTVVDFTGALYVHHRGEETKVRIHMFIYLCHQQGHLPGGSCRLINTGISTSLQSLCQLAAGQHLS